MVETSNQNQPRIGRTGTPEVSVLMSVHNAEKHLHDAVDSILAQSFDDFEFVIIDDGSTDRTSRILNLYADGDQRVVLIEHQNRGLTSSLNVGLKVCKGQFVARMDADDIAFPNRFAEQISFLNTNPEVVAVGTALQLIDSDGDRLGHQVPPASHDEIEGKLFQGVGAVPHPTAMIRRDALLKIQGYDESFRYAQDLDLWLRLSEIGKLANLSTELLQYRLHEKAVTTTKRQEQLACATRAFRNACERRQLEFDSQAILQFTADELVNDAAHTERQHLQMALEAGYFDTALKYAWRQVMRSPFSVRRWKVWLDLKLRRRPKRP